MKELDEYGDDCIHLKACRRVVKVLHDRKGRGCTKNCSAYLSRDMGNFISVDDAVEYARDEASRIEGGYSPRDVYCSCDLHGMTIGDILDEMEE